MKHTPLTHLSLAALFALPAAAQTPNWVLQKPSTKPASRLQHRMVYDSARQVVVLFGGIVGNAASNDTWEYDGSNWKEVTPTTRPSGRHTFVMAYDSVRKVTVLFGGIDATRKFLRDTWIFDGRNWTKIPIGPTAKPSSRGGASMAFDTARGVAVMFGGFDPAKGPQDDTWEWDGRAWKVRTPARSPSKRTFHKTAYDEARQRVVLYGGEAPHLSNETWEYDGTTWTQVRPSNSPPVSHGHNMAFDGSRRRVVVTGGNTDSTHEWNGRNWTKIQTATVPANKYEGALVYDSRRGHLVMFGGNNGGAETWEYRGSECALSTDVDAIDKATGGTQTLDLDAGPAHGGRSYWVFGSVTGTAPGIPIHGVVVPLNYDLYTAHTIANPSALPTLRFRGTLDSAGQAAARFMLPGNRLTVGLTLHHAFIVFDASGRFFCASNPTTLELK